MKTFYNQITLKRLKLLPALIFFLLALSYNVRAQKAVPNPVCYGAPINLQCATLAGCGASGSTYTWSDLSGWTAHTQNVTLNPGDFGYHAGKYYLSVQYLPEGLSSGVVTVVIRNPIIITGTVVNPRCNGDNNGSITLTVSGGSGFYTGYAWSNGATTKNISGLTAGTYTVTVTDDGGCTQKSTPFVVTNPAGIIITQTGGSNVACNGGNDGSIILSVSGGNTPYGYTWSPAGPNSPTNTGLTAGNYFVTVTDAMTCKSTGSYNISQPTGISIASSKQDVSCNGLSNGSISLTASGGVSPYGYAWSNGAGNVSSVNTLSAGTYTVTVTDANSCPKTASWQVSQPSALTLTPAVDQPKCVGNTGSISVSMTGGTAPYGYAWSNGHTDAGATDIITGLTAGTYTVTVTDAHSCTIENSWTIIAPVALSISTVTKTDPTCSYSNDGVITVSVAGGVTPYSYAWSTPPGGSTPSINNLGGGTYTVTVTDGNTCTKTATWLLTAPGVLSITPVIGHEKCDGDAIGTIDLTVTGGTSEYTYFWSSNVTDPPGTPEQRFTPNVSGLIAGNYEVTVTDAHSCIATGAYTITAPAPLSGNGVVTNPKCFGACDGTATITGFGGTSPYYYTWVTGSHEQLITGLCAGRYTVSITDANSCFNYTWQDISTPSEITVSGTPTIVTCDGGENGTITTTVTGGTSGYSYLWNNLQTTPTAVGLAAGTYTVTVTDANSCKQTKTFEVTANPPIVISLVTKSDPSCFASTDGSITVSVAGGLTPYAYAWSTPGGSTPTLSGLGTGTYTVTVTDNGSCVKTGSWSITAPGELTITPVIGHEKCDGDAIGTIDLTVTGGTSEYTYFWSSNVTDPPGTPEQRFTPNVSGLIAGNYAVTVTDAHSCIATGAYTITAPAPLSGNGVVTNPKCFGACDGTATITGFGGTSPYYYTWVTGSHEQLITGLCAGRYTVSITDANSCFNYTWQDISTPSEITISGTPTTITCDGGKDGTITTTVTGGTSGYTYLWNDLQTTPTAVGLAAGTYTVTVTDANSCKQTKTFEVTANPPIVISLVTKSDPSCFASTDGSITVSVAGGLTPYTYAWSTPGGSDPTLSGLGTGTYTVTVTDNGSCVKTGSWSITAPGELTITPVIGHEKCDGDAIGTIDLTVTGGTSEYTYFWSSNVTDPPGTTEQRFTPNVSGLIAGNYAVTVTDAHSCIATGAYTITAPAPLSGNGVVTNPKCFGACDGTATITGFGGTSPYYYTWVTGSHEQLITGLCAGRYTVSITDANSCFNYTWQDISTPSQITILGTPTTITCKGGENGSITTTVSGGTTCIDSPGLSGYRFNWSNGQHTSGISGLTEGTYTVTVTDCNSCTMTQTFEVTANPAIVISLVTKNDPSCFASTDGSITVSVAGGLSPYYYSWSAPGGSTPTLGGIGTGTYTVTVTDQGSCQMTDSWSITAPGELTITPVIGHEKCDGDAIGTIDLTVTGGTSEYTYFWTSNVTDPPGTTEQRFTPNVSGLIAGNYAVTVTDAHSCIATGAYTITAPAPLSGNGVVTNPKCFGACDGTATITGFGGTSPYYYTWVNGSHEQLITGLCAGRYTVSITDANSCFNYTWQDISTPSEITITGTPTTITCDGGADGQITASVSGGTPCTPDGPLPPTPAYHYLWNTGSLSPTIFNLTAGTYTVTVTDCNSCTMTKSFEVTANPPIVISLVTKTDPSCFASTDGSITVSASGGLSPYYYTWSAPGGSTPTLSSLGTGTYTVTVTDQGSCQMTDSWTITAPGELTITPVIGHEKCDGDAIGTIDLTVTGGTSAYTYFWTSNVTDPPGTTEQRFTPNVSGLIAGNYAVTVTDAHSCIATGAYTITAPAPLSGNGVVTNPKCFGACDGTATITGFGGTSPYYYTWVTGSHDQLITGLCAGRYTVSITDANSCFNYTWQDIDTPSEITVTGTPTIVTCKGGEDGSITASATGGTPGYTYNWNNGGTTETITGLVTGIYTVTVTDANTCSMTGSFFVDENPAITITLVGKTNPLCYESADGSVTVSASGGVSPYYYNWTTPPGGTEATVTGLATGTYTVTVTDVGSCQATAEYTVTAPPAVTVTLVKTDITCYTYNNGTITASASGGTTPPGYYYNWSNGATTEAITGLSAGFYTVTVTDGNSCQAIGSAQITEPEPWYVEIHGPTKVCCTSPVNAHYSASVSGWLGYKTTGCLGDAPECPCEACNVTYQWVVVGGTITSGWNTAHITVDWACCTQGTVTVIATRCDGCMLTETLNVIVSLPPAPVITGPASVYANQDPYGVPPTTYCTPEFTGHLYTWTVVGGTVIEGQGTHCIRVQWGPYPPCGCGQVTVCESDTVTGCHDCTYTGCTGCATMNITILPDGQNLEGTVFYKNAYNTPMNGVTVKLRNPSTGTIVATTTSGPNLNPPLYTGDPGYFAFTNIPAGTYQLEASYAGAWGGNNATDALLVQLYVVNPITNPLTGLNLTVADVNASLTWTGLDALYIKLRTVGAITSYPAGDWKFDNPANIIVSPTPTTQNIYGLCVGDVNGSFIPVGYKEASFLTAIADGLQTIPVNEPFVYNIKSSTIADLGAMTLFMGYDQNRFEIESVNTSLEGMKYVIDNGKIALAWSDTKPLSVKNNDAVISLTMNAKEPVSEPTQIFSLIPGSEFADTKANRIENFDLKFANVVTPNGLNEFSMFNYPNPFKNTTNIVYTLPESGKVRLVLTNMYGKTVRVLVDEMQNAGSYTVTVNPYDNMLTPGVYLYKIEVTGATDTYVKVNKMLFTR
jgi:hypothetical protein